MEQTKLDADKGIITLGRLRQNFNLLSRNLREIFHQNYSFFSLMFLLVYSLEQGILLYFSVSLEPRLAGE